MSSLAEQTPIELFVRTEAGRHRARIVFCSKDLGSGEPQDPDYLHVLIEAKKLAFEDRARFYADHGTDLWIDLWIGRFYFSSVLLVIGCFAIAIHSSRRSPPPDRVSCWRACGSPRG